MIEVPLISNNEIKIGAEGLEEIIQNVRMIVGTRKGELVLDRDFGLESMVDKPEPLAKTQFEIEVIDAIEKYEPRVKVSYIKWKEVNEDGQMAPVIGLEVVDELA